MLKDNVAFFVVVLVVVVVVEIDGVGIGFKSQIQMSYSSGHGADCVITKITKQFTIWCPSHCIAHRQRDCSAVCRVGTNVVLSFGSGALPGPCSWKTTCGPVGFSWWESRKGKKLCKSRVNIEMKLGDLFSFTSSPLIPSFSLLSFVPVFAFWKRSVFQFQFFLIVSFYHEILPYLTSRRERKTFCKFLRSNMKWGGVSLRKWEKLLMCFLFNHFKVFF